MSPRGREAEIETHIVAEPYVAPDVQRLGTAEALTAGNFFSLVGDLASNTIPG